jgi:hypothetical protein
MPKPKKPANTGSNAGRLNQIDACTYDEHDRANMPPVGMAGQARMIYIDPPYGIKYGSNFQPFVNKRDVKDKKDEDLSSEPEMIKAFRDRLLLAHELLSDTSSVPLQISDANIHHVRKSDEILSLAMQEVSYIAYIRWFSRKHDYIFFDIRLVRQPGWLSHKSCKMFRILRFFAEVARKLKFPNNSIDKIKFIDCINNIDEDILLDKEKYLAKINKSFGRNVNAAPVDLFIKENPTDGYFNLCNGHDVISMISKIVSVNTGKNKTHENFHGYLISAFQLTHFINSPYEEPKEHWSYDPKTQAFERAAGRRSAGYFVAGQGSNQFNVADVDGIIEKYAGKCSGI